MTTEINFGVDVCAYATVDVPSDTDLSPENLLQIAQDTAVFTPEWDVATCLRVLNVTKDGNDVSELADYPLQPSYHEAGQFLEVFLSGAIPLGSLLASAEKALLVAPSEIEEWNERFTFGAETLKISYSLRRGATIVERHAARCAAMVIAGGYFHSAHGEAHE